MTFPFGNPQVAPAQAAPQQPAGFFQPGAVASTQGFTPAPANTVPYAPAATPAPFFGGIASAKAVVSGNNLKVGTYWVKVKKWEQGEGHKGKRTVLEFDVTRVVSNPEGQANRVGEEASQVFMAKHAGWEGRVKSALMALYNCAEHEITDAAVANALGPANATRGLTVEVVAYRTSTMQNKQQIVATRFSRYVSSVEIHETLSQTPEGKEVLAKYYPAAFLEKLWAAEQAGAKK